MNPDPSPYRPQEGDIVILLTKVQSRQPVIFRRPTNPLEGDVEDVGIKVEIAEGALDALLAMFDLEVAGKITPEVMFVRKNRLKTGAPA